MRSLLECIAYMVFTGGIGWCGAARLALRPVEKIGAAVVLTIITVFVGAWLFYILRAPPRLLYIFPAAGILGWIAACPAIATSWRDPAARALATSQLLVTTWCLGWNSVVENYSGGGWAGDWYEHWERALFFLKRLPTDTLFLGHYPLVARPPLTNVVTAVFLYLSRADFAHYQVITTVLSSLAFIPGALLAHRWRPAAATIALTAVLYMVNPLFVENTSFPWTKLPAACFVLSAIYFYLRAQETGFPRSSAILSATCLAAGLLSHYSAGPYIILLALAWLLAARTHGRERGWWTTTSLAALCGAALLALWFGWAMTIYGPGTTALANSSVRGAAPGIGAQAGRVLLNLWDTVIPHFLRPLEQSLIAQTNAWGHWRDWWFQLYQLNLYFGFGSVAGAAIIYLLIREGKSAPSARSRAWVGYITGAIVLGVAVNGSRDEWGLLHICLQPLVLLGLAFLAARWDRFTPRWQRLLVIGAGVDLLLGIGLQFACESYILDRWLTPGRPAAVWLVSYNENATMNLEGKLEHHLVFWADLPGIFPGAAVLTLLICLGLAIRRVRRLA